MNDEEPSCPACEDEEETHLMRLADEARQEQGDEPYTPLSDMNEEQKPCFDTPCPPYKWTTLEGALADMYDQPQPCTNPHCLLCVKHHLGEENSTWGYKPTIGHYPKGTKTPTCTLKKRNVPTLTVPGMSDAQTRALRTQVKAALHVVVGVEGIAKIMGIPKAKAKTMTRRDGFPKPVAATEIGRLWLIPEILEWKEKHYE